MSSSAFIRPILSSSSSSSKGNIVVIRNTTSRSRLLLPQHILLYRILFLFLFCYLYCVTRTTTIQKDGTNPSSSGGYHYYGINGVYADEAMSTSSNPYHPSNSISTELQRNVDVVSHIRNNNNNNSNSNSNNTDVLHVNKVESFTLGSTINISVGADLTSSSLPKDIVIGSDCLYSLEGYVGNWYSFTAMADVHAVRVCTMSPSSFGLFLAVFADNGIVNGTQSVLQCVPTRMYPYYYFDNCVRDLFLSPFQTIFGKVYRVFVGAPALDSYNIIDFSILTVPPIANDECTNAEPYVIGSTISVFTLYATFDSQFKNNPSCQRLISNEDLLGVWYTFTATAGETYAFEGFDVNGGSRIRVIVYSGNCSNLECVIEASLLDNNGDPLILNAVQQQEQQYYVFVSSSASIPFNLKIVSIRPVTNDLCSNAAPYPLGLRINADTTYATNDGVGYCFSSIDGPGVWYKIVGTGQNIIARPLITGNEILFKTGISIYIGTCDTLECIAVSNSQSICDIPACDNSKLLDGIVNFDSVRGRTYYVKVETEDRGKTPILIQSKCGLIGLQSIFCPLQFNGIIGRIFRRIFYEFGKLIDK